MRKPDEAQTAQTPPPSVQKALPTHIQSFGIALTVGASIEINGKDWVKTSAEGNLTWSSIPSEKELKVATTYMQRSLLEPALEELLAAQGRAVVTKQQKG